MALYFMGDVHYGAGAHDEDKLINLKANASDIVVICGDVGFVWYGDDVEGGRDFSVLEKINSLGFTVCFIEGNHENHVALAQYPVVEFNGGKAHKLRDNIYHLMRGEVFNLQGHICWAFGGAASVDKYNRKDGVSWWKEELPTNEEIMYGFDKIMAVGKVDYIFTHQVPQTIKQIGFPYFSDLDDKYMMTMFDEVYRHVKFKCWYAGHLHCDRKIGKVKILYNSVVKID